MWHVYEAYTFSHSDGHCGRLSAEPEGAAQASDGKNGKMAHSGSSITRGTRCQSLYEGHSDSEEHAETWVPCPCLDRPCLTCVRMCVVDGQGKKDMFSSVRPAVSPAKGTPDRSGGDSDMHDSLSNKTTTSWCRNHKRQFGVVPEVAWGNLTLRDQAKWMEYDCNDLFAVKKKSKPVVNCPVENYDDSGNVNPQLPLIAIMAATTTRNIYEPNVKVLALFQLLFASLLQSLDCDFTYMFVLGYDAEDKFYDTKAVSDAVCIVYPGLADCALVTLQGMQKTKKWFAENIAAPLKEKNIFMQLRTVRVDNRLRKPGPVFLEMARFAYNNGAQFMYRYDQGRCHRSHQNQHITQFTSIITLPLLSIIRVNDDTEFRGRWPRRYANALLSLGAPYGAVGPYSIGSNNRILTHDFVHRLHMEIFDNNYYPQELPDWWMDDWITHVSSPDMLLCCEHNMALSCLALRCMARYVLSILKILGCSTTQTYTVRDIKWTSRIQEIY